MPAPYRAVDIASAFLPQRAHYWYSRCKLALDPLYLGAGAALRDTRAPLLDLGCGIGLLAHALRAQGFAAPYRGVDNDARKVASAVAAAARSGLADARFDVVDLAREDFPAHDGSVALLDVLQFVSEAAASALLAHAARSVSAEGRLLIRTGLEVPGARMRFTRAVDQGSRRIGWMNAAPHRYPTREGLEATFAQHGLRASFAPLTGLLPFHNWLVVARRA
jgi:2-polyprenyl-3-methyl-5-hydroxy-6-metoxy-1,4-benzoquinol methylase